ncbi:maleylpyruvate isomerase N-terminal domain-containing protein [Lentzea sp. HUAS12]|uniref:maleylpyruvate isomerase N-terminal domain-containing protein n=1 Tax=Lentzea sp. HUAS12 TaxID=2951806 RepID=UPI00209D3DEF|nr:maleylpyruvate isomerase N-terminal domain-containing protein [Lentzea sp. HUAS12]USX50737.1 maleylpyruvate isomerase N-terminal domain-containing protein [Lentzea sp. HUAS12]
MAVQNTFIATAHAFTGLVDAVPASRLAGQGLGDWTVRDLVGHAVSAGLAGVLAALGRPATTEDIATPEAYYALAKTVDPAVVDAVVALSTTDAREWGARLGERPADQVRQLTGQVVTAVSGTAPDALVTTAAGGMRLDQWLPTRTFELVVHGFDLAAAVDLPFQPPVDALAESAALAARLAAVTGDGRAVVLALTGRHDLAAGFSVV